MSVQRSEAGYSYIDLATAQRLGAADAVNVYGVVVERTATRKTRGSDMVSVLKIIDPSLAAAPSPAAQLAAAGVDVLFFARDAASMPHPREGDIVRLHRVRLNSFNGRCQLVASLNPRYTFNIPAFCLFRGAPPPQGGDPYEPYQISSRSYHWDGREADILDALRAFMAAGAWRGAGEAQAAQYVRRVRDVISDSEHDGGALQFVDVVGQVLAVEQGGGGGDAGENDGAEANGSGGPPARVEPHVVWVWDASDSPPFPPHYSSPAAEPPRAADSGGGEPEQAPPPPPPRRHFPVGALPPDVLARLPSLGAAVPVVFRAEHQELPEPGSWVKLRNCGFRVARGQLQGLMTAKSRWAVVHPDASVAAEYARRVAGAVVCQWGQGEGPDAESRWFSGVTAPGARDRPLTTLRRLTADTAAPGAAPATYRCLVRVLGHFPGRGELGAACVPARAAWAAAQAQGVTDPRRPLFALRLTLEDGTGSTVDAGLFGTDADVFFADVGVRAEDMGTAPEAQERLRAALDALTGWTAPEPAHSGGEQGRKRRREGEGGAEGAGAAGYVQRWLEVCLAAYVPPAAGGEGGAPPAPRYRIFGTRLKPILG